MLACVGLLNQPPEYLRKYLHAGTARVVFYSGGPVIHVEKGSSAPHVALHAGSGPTGALTAAALSSRD